MKRFIYLSLLMLYISAASAQKYKLIQANHFYDNSIDCRYTGDCVASKYLKNDTLNLAIHINNRGRNIDAYRKSFSYKNDTLSLYLNDTNKVVKTRVYNKTKKRMETFLTVKEVSHQNLYYYDFQQLQFKLTGFTKTPKAIRFHYANLCDCPTKPIKFDIYKNDTINMLNANGKKQGNWIDFYNSGKISKRKKYNNGQFIEGFFYDQEGEPTETIEEGANERAKTIEECL